MGTSNPPQIFRRSRQDHPHAYGDKNIFDIKYYADRGSSPRVWGQAMLSSSPPCSARIIPTRMGTSKEAVAFPTKYVDHPHAYGDNVTQRAYFDPCGGSSPRVWGQGETLGNVGNFSGIIPTRMGTSQAVRLYYL